MQSKFLFYQVLCGVCLLRIVLFSVVLLTNDIWINECIQSAQKMKWIVTVSIGGKKVTEVPGDTLKQIAGFIS